MTIDPAGAATSAAQAAVADATPRTKWWVEAIAVVWLLWVYDAITNLAPLRVHLALAHAQSILSLEQSLGIAPEHALDTWLAGHQTLGLALSDYYDNAHFVVTLGLLAWMWWRRADIYRPLRTALVLANVIAFAVFWRYPVAPPRMLHGFTDVVAATGAIGSWHSGSLASHANELAAMPSLHIAWAVWCSVVIWQLSSRALVRAAGVDLPLHHGLRGALDGEPLRAGHGRGRGRDRSCAADLQGDLPSRAGLVGIGGPGAAGCG